MNNKIISEDSISEPHEERLMFIIKDMMFLSAIQCNKLVLVGQSVHSHSGNNSEEHFEIVM